MNDIFERSRQLLGEEGFESIKKRHVLVCGLGGVGGTCAMALARSGIGELTICDFDVVEESNLNRQILFTSESLGKEKTKEAEKALLSVSPNLIIHGVSGKFSQEIAEELPWNTFDFVIDAIDDIPAKVELIKACQKHGVPLIVSLGMGNRLDPTKITLTKLSKTEGDPLARKLRSMCRQEGIDLSAVDVCFSKETPVMKSPTPGSMMMVPSAAGLAMAYQALLFFLKKN